MLERLAQVAKLELEDPEAGTFTAIASHHDSTAYGERGPTRFARGAFKESLEEHGGKFPLLWQHRQDQPVGVAHLEEASDGLMLRGVLADEVTRAKEARALMKMGAISGVSIGFTAEEARYEKHGAKKEQIRIVEKAKLAEASIVTFPADNRARVIQVHSAETEALERVVFGLVEEVQEGRTFSEANLSTLRGALDSLVGLVEKVDPGYIAALGRRASKLAKKSFIYTAGMKGRRVRHSRLVMFERLVAAQLKHAYPAATSQEEEAPPARLFDDIIREERAREEKWREQDALMSSIRSILEDPRVKDKSAMVRDTVNQFLVSTGAAEASEDETDAAEDPTETHIHRPKVEKRGAKWAVVDADGKVYGTHDSEEKAEAQKRALYAATESK